MEINNKLLGLLAFTAAGLSFGSSAYAENISQNTARMQALDKVTGQMREIEVPVNGEVTFGSFSIIVRSCQTAPQEEAPENYAFVDVADTNREGKTYNIFKGWMLSSSPSLNSVEHPIYDVWLLKCLNTSVDKSKLLSDDVLAQRDQLEKKLEADISKEAKLAIEVQEQQAKREEAAKAEREEQDRILAEEQEKKARQQALEDEIQIQQESEIVYETEDTYSEGDGPVSLLNIGQQNSSAKPFRLEIISEDLPTEQHEEPLSTEVSPSAPEEIGQTEELVVIEDTHHETIQDLNLPPDINEIMPFSNN